MSEKQDQIITALQSGPKTVREIAEAIGEPVTRRVSSILNPMEKKGVVIATGKGGRMNPRVYRLKSKRARVGGISLPPAPWEATA